MSVYPGQRFTVDHNGRTYQVQIEPDDTKGAPWEEDVGCVQLQRVNAGYSRRAGEVFVHQGDRHEWSYVVNMPEALAKARADEWGIPDEDRAAFVREHGRPPSKRETALLAVRANLEFLRGWCADEWSYVGVIVWPDGHKDRAESLWGIESCGDYAEDEVVPDLIEQCERAEAGRTYPVNTLGV